MNLPIDPSKIIADSASLITQNQRLLNVIWPENCGFSPSIMVPRKLTGSETLSEDFSYELELSSIDQTLPAHFLLGLPIGITILQADGETPRHLRRRHARAQRPIQRRRPADSPYSQLRARPYAPLE